MSGTGSRGAELGKVMPVGQDALLRVGGKDPTKRVSLGTNPNTLENGQIIQVSPEDSFKPGQQVMFWLTVYNGIQNQGDPYISRVRLKPWWKRQTLEKRGPGDWGNTLPAGKGWVYADENQFGPGPIADPDPTSSVHASNNRLVWFPVVKMLDITEFGTPPPPVSPARQSDSLFLDDVWTLDLQDPSNVQYAATVGVGQVGPSRSAAFLYVSHGYALGFTHQFDVVGQGQPELFIDITWATGTL